MKLRQLTKKAWALALAAVCAIGMLPATIQADEGKPTYEPLDYKCVSTTLGGMDLSTDGSTWVSADETEALFVFADSSSAKLNLKELGLGSDVSVAEYTGGKKVIYAENEDGKNILLDENGDIYAGIKGYEKCQYLIGDYDGNAYEGWFSYYDVENQKFHLCDTTGEIQLSIDYITEYPTNLHFVHFGGYFILLNYNGDIQCAFEPTGKAEILFELPEDTRVLLADGVIASNGTYYKPDWTETTYEEFKANPIVKDTSNRVIVATGSSDEVYMYEINGVNIYANSWSGEIWDQYEQKIVTEDTADVTVLYSYEDIIMVPIIGSEGCTFKMVLPEEDSNVDTDDEILTDGDADADDEILTDGDADADDEILTDGDADADVDVNDEILTDGDADANDKEDPSKPSLPSVDEDVKDETEVPSVGVEKEIVVNEDGTATVDIELKDSKESISLKAPANVIPENSALRVEKIVDGERFENAQNILKDEIKENGRLYLFEIDLFDKTTEVKVQPNGTLTITITLAEPVKDSETATVYRIELDGTKTKMPTRVVNGKVEFDTDHFSTYAIVINPKVNTVPDTSDTSVAWLWIGMMTVGFAMVGVTCYKKRELL